ncbi:MAG: glycosyltransferase family 2 protein [Verrucomicrobia bacterium]|nr:glycosyltransferase family 2 protein [Verrucomicrobiota bacterium]
MKKLCLNMIVKNENHVIHRCLSALKDHIDYWVIVDTGSTDGTQEAIREIMEGCPGELYERPWVNFEHNRNEALDLARGKGDYILFVDADEVMNFLPSFNKEALDRDFYLLKTVSDGHEFFFPKLIRDDAEWEWTHVLHEFIRHKGNATGEILDDIWTLSVQDGARSRDPNKLYKDIDILKKAIKKEPYNPRYYFYLGQTYSSANEYELALENYEIRGNMEGDKDETFWALYCVGHMQETLNMDPSVCIKSYCRAFKFDPTRAEPLERIANYYFQNDCMPLAYILMKYAQTLPTPIPMNSGFYSWVYDFAVYSICADCAVELGKKEEAIELYNVILSRPNKPPGLEEHLRKQISRLDGSDYQNNYNMNWMDSPSDFSPWNGRNF